MRAIKQFWMVWNPNPNGRVPKVRHWTRAEAEEEARRLARLQPSDEFYVLEAIKMMRVPVQETDIYTLPF